MKRITDEERIERFFMEEPEVLVHRQLDRINLIVKLRKFASDQPKPRKKKEPGTEKAVENA